MKKLVLAVCVLAASSQAFAINHAYRDKLIRSGCNEMNAGQGCDINKSAEYNARHGFGDYAPARVHGRHHGSTDYLTPAPRTPRAHHELNAFLEDSVLGQDVQDARAALFGYGCKRLGPDHWSKNGFDIRLTSRNGVVISGVVR